MNILICDDDKKFGEVLKEYIYNIIIKSKYYDDNYRIEYYYSSKDALTFLKNNDVDIAILDIIMPGIDGFELAEYINNNKKNTYIIFVSNYEEIVFKSFVYNPFRFIRKIKYEKEIEEAITTALSNIYLKNSTITVNLRNEIATVLIPQIIYIEKEKNTNYVQLFFLGKKIRQRGNISAFDHLIEDHNFYKASSTALINMEQIITINGEKIQLAGGYEYCITSSKYRSAFKRRYLEFKSSWWFNLWFIIISLLLKAITRFFNTFLREIVL